MNKISSFILTLAAVAALTACSDVDENERLTYVKPADVARKVLIEDFTGQKCVHCPDANDEIEALQKQFGADSIIAVGIHSGPLGFKGTSKLLGLATTEGDEYYNYWGIDYQPKGMVNRGAPDAFTSWTAQVLQQRAIPAKMDMSMNAQLDATGKNINITVNTLGTNGTVNGKLQLWVVEDSIVAMQKLPSGAVDYEYMHMHVYRKAVNGLWGDDFSTAEGEEKQLSYTVPVDEKWVVKHVAIVAFVYNGSGVEQVDKAYVKE